MLKTLIIHFGRAFPATCFANYPFASLRFTFHISQISHTSTSTQ